MTRSRARWRGRAYGVAAAVLVAAGCGKEAARTPGAGQTDAPAPEYEAIALDGSAVSLAGQRDKVVLLNAWATWCHPCREEIPELIAIHEKYKSRGLALIGVSVDSDGSEEAIKQFIREYKMTYPIWLDPGERISASFRIVGVPTTFLIDRGGVLRWRKTGPIQPNDTALVAAIEGALGKQ